MEFGKSKSANHSDSDDWTLISPAHSSNSSLEQDHNQAQSSQNDGTLNVPRRSAPVGDDDLTEIELRAVANKSVQFQEPDGRSSSAEPNIPGFQPITSDDDENEESHSRRSSLSDIGDFVDLGKKSVSQSDITQEDSEVDAEDEDDEEEEKEELVEHLDNCADILKIMRELRRRNNQPNLEIKARLEELSRVHMERNLTRLDRKNPYFVLLILFCSIPVLHLLFAGVLPNQSTRSKFEHDSADKQQKKSAELFDEVKKDYNSFVGDTSHSSQLFELNWLNTELSQCIRRQSPSSFKYYMSRDNVKGAETQESFNYRPYKGLVCYGQETEWRRRLDQLKVDHNLDLPELMQQAKRRVTNDMIASHHPALQYRLVLNQIEYLDYLEARRKKRQSEDMIKHLKSENFQLLRRLNRPNEAGNEKLMRLEQENSKLKRDNEALRAGLLEKAGPVYIKQSLELRQSVLENDLLKLFHFNIAKDISRILKRFNLLTVDASRSIDDIEGLKAQLTSTRSYVQRLGEKVGIALEENEALREQLNDLSSLSLVDDNVTNAPTLPSREVQSESEGTAGNALMADGCVRNLMELRDKTRRMEEEIVRLRDNCSNRNVNLEKASIRHLNRTSEPQFDERLQTSRLLQTGQYHSAISNALDKRTSDLLLLRGDDLVADGALSFLTAFNRRAEASSEIALLDDYIHKSANLVVGNDEPRSSMSKTLPNYIREQTVKRHLTGLPSSDVAHKLAQPAIPTLSLGLKSPGANDTAMRESNSTGWFMGGQIFKEMFGHNQSVNQNKCRESIAGDGWLFKRAKQRKQLRNVRSDPRKTTDWLSKRANLRDKLRKASAHLDEHYSSHGSVKHNQANDRDSRRPPSKGRPSSSRSNRNHESSPERSKAAKKRSSRRLHRRHNVRHQQHDEL